MKHLPVFRAPHKGGLGPRENADLVHTKKSRGKGTRRNKQHLKGRTSRLLDRIAPVGRFGENICDAVTSVMNHQSKTMAGHDTILLTKLRPKEVCDERHDQQHFEPEPVSSTEIKIILQESKQI